MKVAEVKTFLKCPKIFRIALQTKKLQRFENFAGASTTPCLLFGGPIARAPGTRFACDFLQKDGLEQLFISKKGRIRNPEVFGKNPEKPQGGGCTNPPLWFFQIFSEDLGISDPAFFTNEQLFKPVILQKIASKSGSGAPSNRPPKVNRGGGWCARCKDSNKVTFLLTQNP